MDYRKMSADQRNEVRSYALSSGNVNAAREIADFEELFNKTVTVVKGRKVPHGTTGVVFWLKRYDFSKYGDPWGIYSDSKIGIKDDYGNVYFTSAKNVVIAE